MTMLRAIHHKRCHNEPLALYWPQNSTTLSIQRDFLAIDFYCIWPPLLLKHVRNVVNGEKSIFGPIKESVAYDMLP